MYSPRLASTPQPNCPPQMHSFCEPESTLELMGASCCIVQLLWLKSWRLWMTQWWAPVSLMMTLKSWVMRVASSLHLACA